MEELEESLKSLDPSAREKVLEAMSVEEKAVCKAVLFNDKKDMNLLHREVERMRRTHRRKPSRQTGANLTAALRAFNEARNVLLEAEGGNTSDGRTFSTDIQALVVSFNSSETEADLKALSVELERARRIRKKKPTGNCLLSYLGHSSGLSTYVMSDFF